MVLDGVKPLTGTSSDGGSTPPRSTTYQCLRFPQDGTSQLRTYACRGEMTPVREYTFEGREWVLFECTKCGRQADDWLAGGAGIEPATSGLTAPRSAD